MSEELWSGALPEAPDVCTACVLGASGVGKTTLMRALMEASRLRATPQRSARLRAGRHGLDALADDDTAQGTRAAKLPVAYRAGARLVAHVDSPGCERYGAQALRAASVADIAVVVVSAVGSLGLRDALLAAWAQRVPEVVVWVNGVDAFEGWDALDQETWTLEVREALRAVGAWEAAPIFFGSAREASALLRRERGRGLVLETPALAPLVALLDVLAAAGKRPVGARDGALRLAVGWGGLGHVPEAGRRRRCATVMGRLERGSVAVGETVEVAHVRVSDRMDLGHREGGSGRVWVAHSRVVDMHVAGQRAARAEAGDWVGLALAPRGDRRMRARSGALVTTPGDMERDDWVIAARVRAVCVPARGSGWKTAPLWSAPPERAEVHVWTPTGSSRARWEALGTQDRAEASAPLSDGCGVRLRLRLTRPLALRPGARWVGLVEGRVAAVGHVEAVEARAPERAWYEGADALLPQLRAAFHGGEPDDAVADGLALWGARDVCEASSEATATRLSVLLDYLMRHIAQARDPRRATSPEGLWRLTQRHDARAMARAQCFMEIKLGWWRGLRLLDAPLPADLLGGGPSALLAYWRVVDDWRWRRWTLGPEGRLHARSELVYAPGVQSSGHASWCLLRDTVRWDREADIVHRVVRCKGATNAAPALRLEYARVVV